MHRSEITCNLASPELERLKPTTTTTMSNHSHIPVPKSFGTPNKSTLHSLTKRGNALNTLTIENKTIPQSPTLQARVTSVAAQRASFERLDAAAASANVQKRNFHDNYTPPLSNYQAKLQDNSQQTSLKKTMIMSNSMRLNGGNNNNGVTSYEGNWKMKYEDSERKRKILLQKSETGNIYI